MLAHLVAYGCLERTHSNILSALHVLAQIANALRVQGNRLPQVIFVRLNQLAQFVKLFLTHVSHYASPSLSLGITHRSGISRAFGCAASVSCLSLASISRQLF